MAPKRTARRWGILLAATACAMASVSAATAATETRTAFYVSPTGSGGACAWHVPCSLDRAKARVAEHNAHRGGDIAVYLRGGTYRLTSAFRLGPADSGRRGTVTYLAYPGERPVLTGAKRVTGFALSDPAKNIYRAAVPAGTTARQLYVDGVRAERARTPLNPAGFTATATGFTTADPSYAALTNQADVEVVRENKWKHLRCPLSSITPSGTGSALTVQPDCWRNNNTAVVNRQFPFNGNGLPKLDNVSWVENAYQLLTRPGQWYLDRHAGALYYLPLPGQDMAAADVELPSLETLVSATGTPGHLAPVDDTGPGTVYTGQWQVSGDRGFGDYADGVHVSGAPGAAVTYQFTGTGLDVLGETNTGHGDFVPFVDGRPDFGRHTENGTTRLAQQVVYSVKGLRQGRHTVTLVSRSAAPLVVDAFVVTPEAVTPVHDVAFRGLTFTGTGWTLPSADGYLDNQAGVQWAAAEPHAPIRMPAAVEIRRGDRIAVSGNTFTHLGGAGLALSDGTRHSSVERNHTSDTAGTGIALGEVDDYYLTDPARMTTDDTIADNTVETPGQDYHDAVGIWVGHAGRTLLAHNEVRHTPYSGISLGWGWGFASPCDLQAKQGLKTCRRGTIYSGENRIIGNHVHDVMRTLLDGGPIYTLGGGDGDGTVSEFAGNWLHDAPNNNNLIYHDEGSSHWDTHDNVVSNPTGRWVGMWTPTIHDIAVHGNFTDNTTVKNLGTNVTITGTTVVTGGDWPARAREIMAAAGPR